MVKRTAAAAAAGVVGVILVTPVLVSAPEAAAASAPTIFLSRTTGAVGDTVSLSGTSGCATASSVGVEFEGKAPTGAVYGVATVALPTGTGGRWSIHAFEIPEALHGGATFMNAAVTAGTYVLRVGSTCGGNASAPFQVTAGVAAQPSSRFVGTATTPDGGGYWLVGAGGEVYTFGDAGYYGSAGSSGLPR